MDDVLERYAKLAEMTAASAAPADELAERYLRAHHEAWVAAKGDADD